MERTVSPCAIALMVITVILLNINKVSSYNKTFHHKVVMAFHIRWTFRIIPNDIHININLITFSRMDIYISDFILVQLSYKNTLFKEHPVQHFKIFYLIYAIDIFMKMLFDLYICHEHFWFCKCKQVLITCGKKWAFKLSRHITVYLFSVLMWIWSKKQQADINFFLHIFFC